MSNRVPVKDGLQINDHKEFERKDWRAQRIGWAVMALLIALALIGALGRGPVSDARVDIQPGATLKYDRITRHQSPAELTIHADAGSADSLIVDIARDFMDGVDLKSVHPEPERVVTGGDALRFVFARGVNLAADVKLSYEPVHYWARRGWVRVDNGEPAEFTQFVLP